VVTLSLGAGTKDIGFFVPKVTEPPETEDAHAAGGHHGH
jgi:hypothetical protein